MTPAYAWKKDEVAIIKAAWATDEGRMALQLVVERLCDLHGGPSSLEHSALAFHAGRRFVGRELAAAINQPVDKIVKEQHDDSVKLTEPLTATERAARVASGQWERGGAKRKR